MSVIETKLNVLEVVDYTVSVKSTYIEAKRRRANW